MKQKIVTEILVANEIFFDIENWKNKTIKSIMRVVDDNSEEENKRKIRNAVLDEVNDLSRRITERLELELRNGNSNN